MAKQVASIDTKGLNIITHILGMFIGSSLVLGFLGPLLIYLLVDNKEVKEHGKNALNWQISLLIYSAIAGLLWVVSLVLSFIIVGIPFLVLFSTILFVLVALNIIFSIIAAIKANDDIVWEYPLSIRFFK
ncbi:MAG: DUF4870 domain-containing protein [Candidatus Nanoarchaeia archaeon]